MKVYDIMENDSLLISDCHDSKPDGYRWDKYIVGGVSGEIGTHLEEKETHYFVTDSDDNLNGYYST